MQKRINRLFLLAMLAFATTLAVNTGDQVKFSAEKIGGAYTVTAIEAAK